MKKLKFIASAALSACLLLPVAGCGGGLGGGGGTADGKITVLLDIKDKTYLERVIGEFETEYAEQGYTVDPVWTAGGDIQSQQAQKIGIRKAPDVIVGGDMYTEVYNRSLLDLSEFLERDAAEVDVDDILPGIMDSLKNEDGKVVFMPRFFNISLLYYNKTLFDNQKEALLEADITPAPEGTPDAERHYPHLNWTVEDYFKAGEILTHYDSGTASYSQLGSTSVNGWWGEWLIHLRQAGGDMFDENGLVDFDGQAAKDMVQLWYDKAYGNGSTRGKISSAPGESDLGGFQSNKVAMEYGGHTANWPRYDALSDLNWGVTLLPTGTARRAGAEFAVDGYGIFKDSPDKEAAWAFIKFLTDKEGIEGAVAQGYLTVRQSVYDGMAEGVNKARTKLAIDAITGVYGEYAMTLPKQAYFAEVANTLIDPTLALVIAKDSSRLSVEEACAKIHRECNDYIELNYS